MTVVIDGPRTPAWQARTVELIERSPELRLAGVRAVDGAGAGDLRRWRRDVERRLFPIPADALAPAVVSRSLERAGEPDPAGAGGLVLWLADASPPARAGVLRLVHGPYDEPACRAFARAVHEGADVIATTAVLGGEPPRVVARSVSGVRPFSATLTASLALWKCAELAVRAAVAAPGLDEPIAPPPRGPTPPRRVAVTGRVASRWTRTLATRVLYRRPWEIRVRHRRADPAAGWEHDDGLVRWRPGHVYADPMLLEHAGGHHLFCEDLAPGADHGVISYVELVDGEAAGPPEPVLERPHHLSYPHVFVHDGEVLLVPEARSPPRVELHRATAFPRRWELAAVLLEGVDAVDATLFEHDGRWWMLAAVAAPGASLLDELHAFHAPAPHGPWTPHAANPVVSDVRHARPAGAVLRRDGRLLRPAQDGSRRYGWAVSLREIVRLTPTAYAEREVVRLTPALVPGARALHSYAITSRYEAIDIRRKVPRAGLRAPRVAGRARGAQPA